MPDKHYQHPRLVEVYDVDSPWSVDRDFYFNLAGARPLDILDLGCGTGILSLAYANKGHRVTGVDPALEMLRRAQRKVSCHPVEWIQCASQNFSSDKRFDLIIMTGHVFQVLLTDADILSALNVMRQHLAFAGRIVFESRNPAIDWARDWNYRVSLETPGGLVIETRRLIEMVNDRMSFELVYEFENETLVSASELRFLRCDRILEMLLTSGLQIVNLLGDWDHTPFDDATSQEMIFVAKAK
jgi:ubiquinone/menaquinone biosynthesis C-methylase UbiE